MWLVSLCACEEWREPDRTKPLPFKGHGFRAQLRMDVSTNKLEPAPGVTLYDFHVGSMPLFIAYVGDQPGFPHFAFTPEHETDKPLASGLRAHCRGAQQAKGAARECLITLSDHSPKQLHVWYEDLAPRWAEVADRIIASVQPGKLNATPAHQALAP